ncbi:MAG: tRNA pseudouridine(38-40) synthase TruA [Halobacteriota archaeon]|jgi:tRNA pseudouridine38-40 synthase
MEKSRVALRLAYVGTHYAGFQAQPGRRTVQAAVVEALRRARLIEEIAGAHFTASGRTDKGVHAVDAVISFETEVGSSAIPRRINSQLPKDIWTWARADVPMQFDARRDAVLREYQYVLCDAQFDVHAMRLASDLLLGVHDFRNFSLEKGRSTVRKVFSSRVRVSDDFIVIEVAADSFVWNMMRKLVTALTLVGNGQRSVAWFGNMLDPNGHTEGIRSAPASGLILTRVDYAGIEFVEDKYAKKRAHKYMQEILLQNSVMMQIFKRFNEQMGGSAFVDRA